MRLKLPGVTVCAVDCLNPRWAANAIARSMAACDFDDAILLTDDAEVASTGGYRTIQIASIGSKDQYSACVPSADCGHKEDIAT